MGTTIRPEISDKNKYWIDKHRYYELKHFCLQYPLWQKALNSLDGMRSRMGEKVILSSTGHSDPTLDTVIARSYFKDRIDLIRRAAKLTDPEIGDYILKAVTNGFSYDYMHTRLNMPCGRDTYYDRYRKFFWILNHERG